ncbi:hypothetical protein COCON_G00035610 [Conger conger]|uniref:Uncharacterized protein n=1 Tax=Conger conger TaxID=82655 RepID=A0A9Q1DZG8_CONCO|nr:hypothetical protein COCON_G00035610 [Conger conger]
MEQLQSCVFPPLSMLCPCSSSLYHWLHWPVSGSSGGEFRWGFWSRFHLTSKQCCQSMTNAVLHHIPRMPLLDNREDLKVTAVRQWTTGKAWVLRAALVRITESPDENSRGNPLTFRPTEQKGALDANLQVCLSPRRDALPSNRRLQPSDDNTVMHPVTPYLPIAIEGSDVTKRMAHQLLVMVLLCRSLVGVPYQCVFTTWCW